MDRARKVLLHQGLLRSDLKRSNRTKPLPVNDLTRLTQDGKPSRLGIFFISEILTISTIEAHS
jgi:hypothetical protein